MLHYVSQNNMWGLFTLPFCKFFHCSRALELYHFIIAMTQALNLLLKIYSLSPVLPFWPGGYWEALLLQKQLFSL